MKKQSNSGYLCFLAILQFLGVKLDKEFEERFTNSQEDCTFEIVRTAEDLKLKVKNGKLKSSKIKKTTVPVIAKQKDGTFIILVKYVNGKWLILDPLVGRTENFEEETIKQKLSGDIIVIGKKENKTQLTVESHLVSVGLFQPLLNIRNSLHVFL